jgi:hypothetical protein
MTSTRGQARTTLLCPYCGESSPCSSATRVLAFRHRSFQLCHSSSRPLCSQPRLARRDEFDGYPRRPGFSHATPLRAAASGVCWLTNNERWRIDCVHHCRRLARADALGYARSIDFGAPGTGSSDDERRWTRPRNDGRKECCSRGASSPASATGAARARRRQSHRAKADSVQRRGQVSRAGSHRRRSVRRGLLGNSQGFRTTSRDQEDCPIRPFEYAPVLLL